MSLNLSQIFVRYPDVKGAAQAVETWLAARLKTQPDVPRHVCVSTGTPWIGIFAWGNGSPPELGEHVSLALEAHAIWFGLSGRALAYRLRRFHLGRATDDVLVPRELFESGDRFPLPAYPDAEQELHMLLMKEGVPAPYIFSMAEELGASAKGKPDAVVLAAAPWAEGGLQHEPFAHRLVSRPPGVRTLFDQCDEEKQIVSDDVMLRGTYDEDRARALLATLQKMRLRRVVLEGWTVTYRVESPVGKDLLDPLAALFARERGPMRLSYQLAIE